MDQTEPLTIAEQRVLDALQDHGGYVRTGDILEAGIDHHILARLTERGLLERVRRGLYRRADMISADVAVADVAAAAPDGVVCLLTALAHYELTTTTPWEVYLAIRRKAWPPKIEYPPVRVVFYSDGMFGYGIRQEPLSNDRAVRMYSPEKSIADAFHFEDMPAPRVQTYSIETVVAEKFEAMIGLALVNGRLKDFFDVYQLAHTEAFDGLLLQEAVANTFRHRGTGFDPNHPIFDDRFGTDSERQRHWTAFLRRTGLRSAPGQFADVTVFVRGFLLPIYEACASGTGFRGAWSTGDHTWTRM